MASWTEFAPAVSRGELLARPAEHDWTPADQYEAARAAAVAVIDSGAVGGGTAGTFKVSLNGYRVNDGDAGVEQITVAVTAA